MRCYALRNDIEGYDTDSFLEWKGALRYEKYHGKVCFICHVPQCDDKLHDTFTPDASNCRSPDVIAPLAFGIFCKPELKHAAQEKFRVQWPTLASYARWLCGTPVPNHKTNTTAIFLWYTSHYHLQPTP